MPTEIDLLASARHHLVAGQLGPTRRHPVAAFIGDLMVRETSALGLGSSNAAALDWASARHSPA